MSTHRYRSAAPDRRSTDIVHVIYHKYLFVYKTFAILVTRYYEYTWYVIICKENAVVFITVILCVLTLTKGP